MKNFKQILFSFIIFSFIFLGCDIESTKAAGASLYLAPASGTYVIGGTFTVGVKVNSGGAEVNAAEGGISFDANLLEVVSVSNGGSIFPFWTVSPTFSNSAGTINFGGGMPPPAYTGTAGHIINVTFKAKNSGTAAVRFTSGAVLANDGKGTNILASMGSASYVVSPKVAAPPPEKAIEPTTTTVKKDVPVVKKEEPVEVLAYNTPLIKSATHKADTWSNKRDVEFSWDLPEGVTGVSIGFDQEPLSDPGPKSDGLFDKKLYSDVADGVWYLHLKFQDSRRWGTVAHYRVMIDTVAPESFEASLNELRIGEWPVMNFKTEDTASGMDRYEIFVGSLVEQEHVLKPEIEELELMNLEAGDHVAIVKAVDKAGNETISSVSFKVDSIPSPEIVDYAREFKSSDSFYASGKAYPGSQVNIYIQGDNNTLIASTTVAADQAGKWFYLHDGKFGNGRYIVWVMAVNELGIKSLPSGKKTFLVTPPVFTMVGSFVVDYFTVFVSLLFMILLIIALIILIVWLLRKRLRKETYEIEDVLRSNLAKYSKTISKEFISLKQYEGKRNYKTEKAKTEKRLLEKLEQAEAKILKEVKDVEKILK